MLCALACEVTLAVDQVRRGGTMAGVSTQTHYLAPTGGRGQPGQFGIGKVN
ncbi:hypothetical protein ANOBCDAF_04357 [Pleomorphomonas sp. T1.2MG-36]|nr:hypothetical protein ANOBCDAF_04357 [Pleomorphomonas sp. T1.2MG-36]